MAVEERTVRAAPAPVGLGLADVVAASRFELVPVSGALEAPAVLPRGTPVTVTSSPTRGLEPTLELCEGLSPAGYAAMPHLAARSVRDGAHLAEVLARLDAAGISKVVVVGGDAKDRGVFRDGLSLLRAIDDLGHRFADVTVPAYPEGHPTIPDEALVQALLDKQPYATSMTTQLCFHPEALRRWVPMIRARGVTLPLVIGLPGPVHMAKLARIAAKIGVAGTARYLQEQRGLLRAVLGRRAFRPDHLMPGLVPTIEDPLADVRALHIFTFNEVEASFRWQSRTLERLGRG
jgi:methylenetetrahydrofolate reductase (NADPH)